MITSVNDSYEDVLHPLGFKAVLINDNELAVPPRKVNIETFSICVDLFINGL